MKRILLIALLGICALGTFAQKYVGGDISLLPKYEQANAHYYEQDGKAIASPLTFFKEQGMNAMRLRLFVDPSKNTGEDKDANVCQDLEYVKTLGKRIKDAGFKLMLDFHYSDTWADPGKQWTPDAWKNLTDAQLQQKLYDYTKDVLQQMKAAGAKPDMIQTGNEITYGMLWGTRAAVGNNNTNRCWPSSTANWSRFTNLLKQATKACREECPEAKIIIHSERTSISQQNDNKNYAALSNFYQHMKAANIDYDIIGLSYYPYFHGAISELEGAINLLEKNYADKDIMVVEFGYPYAWAVGGTTYNYTSKYPYSDEGQKAITTDLITMLNKHQHVNGLFWWWMEYNAKDSKLSESWYNAPLFDSRTGKATSALYELKNFVGDATGIAHVTADKAHADNQWYTLDGKKETIPSTSGIYIHNHKKIAIKK